jgi:hypothetical protein
MSARWPFSIPPNGRCACGDLRLHFADLGRGDHPIDSFETLETAMLIAYLVVGGLLALGVLASASAQIARNKTILQNMAHLGVPLGMLPFLATCLIAGAAGLVIGVWYAPLGLAAAGGLVLYFVGAVIAHLRKGDAKGMPAPLLFLALSAGALSLLALS